MKSKNGLLRCSILLLGVLFATKAANLAFAEEEKKPAESPKLPAAAAEFDGDDSEGRPKEKGKLPQRTLTISLGVSRTIELPFDIGPISITDGSFFSVRRVAENGRERKLIFIGQNPGVTDMTISENTTPPTPRVMYIVRVTREDVGQVISQLEEFLGDIEGLKLRSVGGTIFLDGEILLPRDMIRIFRVVEAMKDRDPKKKEIPIKNLTVISKITMNIIAERIEREINSPEISARVLNNNIILEGTAEGDFEADRAIEIAKTYLPEAFIEKNKGEGGEIKPREAGGVGGGVPKIIDFLRVRPRPSAPPAQDIKITMNYVELKNDYQKNFNFEWRPLATDSSSVKYDSSLGELSANFVATVSSLLPKLISAKSHGHARVLKQETLIVKDKAEQPATIESSLQVYVQNINEKGERSLQAIQVPNVTKVRAATIGGTDSIELGIQITLNSLVGTGNTPSVSTNSLQTQVTVKNGDSAALGGYAIDNIVADYNRDPGAKGGNSTGSPLFNMQRSKGYQRDKQQFIIFVTPEVIRTAGAATDDMSRKFRLNAGER